MNFVEKSISYAPEAFRYLRGILCVYKPAGMPTSWLQNAVRHELCKELNSLSQRPHMTDVAITGSLRDERLELVSHPSYSDHPLVTGPRFQRQDIRMTSVHQLFAGVSGVALLALTPKRKDIDLLQAANMIRTYQLDCKLGVLTDTGMVDGKPIQAKSFRHVTPALMEKLLGSIMAIYQKHAFDFAGIRPDSQEAYEAASRGLVRPQQNSPPLVYAIKCTTLEPPHFTLEMQVINEQEPFLRELVCNIGHKLRSAAAIERLKLVRLGPFTAELALLQRQWRLEPVLQNIQDCAQLLDQMRYSNLHKTPTPGHRNLRVLDPDQLPNGAEDFNKYQSKQD